MEIGDAVIYVDERATPHVALVTAVWPGYPGGPGNPGLNLVYASENDTEHDQYGRQIKRQTSVVHKSAQPAHGRYWYRTDEAVVEVL